MNTGYQPGLTYSEFVISGKMNATCWDEPRARAAAPPRSKSQYQRAKTMTFVSQIVPPQARSTLALLVKGTVPRILMTSRTAADAFTAEIKPIIVPVSRRSQVDWRSIRRGSPMMSTKRSARTVARKSQRASRIRSSDGSVACSTPVARTASAIGQRDSPALGDPEGWVSSGSGLALVITMELPVGAQPRCEDPGRL